MIRMPQSRNHRIAVALVGFVLLMCGLAYASAPLYSLFCRATGFGGTTQTATSAPARILDRTVTVDFDANVDASLPWSFEPTQHSVTVRIGEPVTITYRAHNKSNQTVTGNATYNVQPDKVGSYFDKIQCFCFTQQTLKGGESVEMPVRFFVDPSMADDPNDNDVQHITLSYTFFLAKKQATTGDAKQITAVIAPKTPNP
ncbi:MAG: cytochrome c oxidase assembly protein [Alphaproteobacteria bacterium]|nr:cytochrome c oxidase assembly protein [Alphaproteobacteria bacterium]MBV8548510.1 cytochrome c oxidase assembly protein [Alphaproteobacteria bacterium]